MKNVDLSQGPLSQGKYKRNVYIYGFMTVFWVTYACVAIVWTVVPVHNLAITHTYFQAPGMPGAKLTSFRGSLTSIAISILIVIHNCWPIAVLTVILFRKNAIISLTLLAIMFVTFVITLFGLAVLGNQYSHCNGQNQYGNICNALNLCCVHEILIESNNHCPNTIDCAVPLTLDDVGPNTTFLQLFWINFVMFVLQLIFFIVMVVIWATPVGEEETEEQEPTTEEEKKKAAAAVGIPEPLAKMIVDNIEPAQHAPKRSFGLRQRKKQ